MVAGLSSSEPPDPCLGRSFSLGELNGWDIEMYIAYLVGGLELFLVFHILGIS